MVGWRMLAAPARSVFFFIALLPFQPRLQSMAAMGAFTAQLTHTLRVFTQRGSLIQTSISLLRCSFSDFMADDQTFMIFFLSSVIPPLTDFRLLTVGSCLRAVIILKKKKKARTPALKSPLAGACHQTPSSPSPPPPPPSHTSFSPFVVNVQVRFSILSHTFPTWWNHK